MSSEYEMLGELLEAQERGRIEMIMKYKLVRVKGWRRIWQNKGSGIWSWSASGFGRMLNGRVAD